LTPDAAQLAAALSQLQQAQAALARLQPTVDNLKIAQDQVDQAEAALALAQQQVANASLTAPMDGTIVWVGPHVGDTAAQGGPMMIIADLTHLQLQAGVDENALAQLHVGQTVAIVPEAFKNQNLKGKVARIGWLATTTAGVINIPVTIDVDANDLPLRPGLSATAEIQK
jgi:HlyD family secretion protein